MQRCWTGRHNKSSSNELDGFSLFELPIVGRAVGTDRAQGREGSESFKLWCANAHVDQYTVEEKNGQIHCLNGVRGF